MTGTKHCKRCGETKPATTNYFYRNSQRSDGLHAYCKDCKANIHRDYMKDPDVREKVYQKLYEWQKGIGREKFVATRRRYDKSEKRRAWRHDRTKRAKEFAETFVKELWRVD